MVMCTIISKCCSYQCSFLQFCQLQQEALDFFGIEESKMLVGQILQLLCDHEFATVTVIL